VRYLYRIYWLFIQLYTVFPRIRSMTQLDYETLFQVSMFSDQLVGNIFLTYSPNNVVVRTQASSLWQISRLYQSLPGVASGIFDALKEPEKRDWVKNKVAERQLIRRVRAFSPLSRDSTDQDGSMLKNARLGQSFDKITSKIKRPRLSRGVKQCTRTIP
jgi:hypothetical protein